MTSRPEAGWYRDPAGTHRYRYWDGVQWTSQVNDGGANGTDPVSPELANVPPVPGTAAQQPSATPQQQPAIHVTAESSPSSSVGMIIGVIIAIAAIVIAFMLISGGGDNGDEGTETTVTTVAPTEPEDGGDGS
jgi:hypothetical protein